MTFAFRLGGIALASYLTIGVSECRRMSSVAVGDCVEPILTNFRFETFSLSSTGTLLVGVCRSATGKNYYLHVWQLGARRLLWSTPLAARPALLSFSPDERSLAAILNDASGNSSSLRLYEVISGRQRLSVEHDSRIGLFLFAPSGREFLVADRTGSIHGIDVMGKHVWRITPERAYEGETIVCGAISPDGKLFATGSSTCLRLWRVTERKAPEHLRILYGSKAEPAHPVSLCFSPMGDVLYFVENAGTIRGLLLPTGKAALEVNGGPEGYPALCLSPSGAELAVAEQTNGLAVWSMASKSWVLRSGLAKPPVFFIPGQSVSLLTLPSDDERTGGLRIWQLRQRP